MNEQHLYESMTDIKNCDVIDKCNKSDSSDCLAKQQNQWEYEQIYKSLKNSNCDDVIKILLTETQTNCKSNAIAEQNYCDFDENSLASSSASPSHAINKLASFQDAANCTVPMKSNTFNGFMCDTNKLPTSSAVKLRANQKHQSSQRPFNQNNVVINLDKNRINLRRHRAKLLPRPISLPTSLKLFRNLYANNGSMVDDKQCVKVDLEFIKRLEDNIYGSRCDDNSINNRDSTNLSNGTINPINCDQCNKIFSKSYQPNQIVEQKTFDDKLMRFNTWQHAVLLLDSWQLQPILMKNDASNDITEMTTTKITLNNNCNTDDTKQNRSIVIVDNSSFYPVFMTYEIGTNRNILSPKISSVDEHNDTCECMENNQHTEEFTNLFHARVEQLVKQLQTENQWNISEVKPLSTIQSKNVDEKCLKTAVKSSFVRFMQRVRFRSKVKADNKNDRAAVLPINNEIPIMKKHSIDTRTNRQVIPSNCIALNESMKLNNYEKNNNQMIYLNDDKINQNSDKRICSDETQRQRIIETKAKYTMNNIKLKWLLCTKPKIDAFKTRLVKRRHTIHGNAYNQKIIMTIKTNIANDKNEINACQLPLMITPNDYDIEYCRRFQFIGWSCSDLLDIHKADRLRKIYMKQEKYHKRMQSKWIQSEKYEKNKNKMSESDSNSNSLVNGSSGESFVRKNVKRRSSFRLKRHSVDSASVMTDVVKAWVYRKRCLSIFKFHFNFSIKKNF